PCVAGAGELRIDATKRTMRVRDVVVRDGDLITIDGSKGEVMLGQVPTIQPELSGDFAKLMGWADRVRKTGVRANADTPADARTARKFGAEGIGLCRTEHMFFEGNRIEAVREMILAEDEAGRRKALAKLLPMQRGDFLAIFEEMKGLPVIIRLLDPPLHEFLPKTEEEIAAVAQGMGVSVERVRNKAESLQEFNPMLGHRGCRLGIAFPEITEMQARAIFEAASQLAKQRKKVLPEIMIPLVGIGQEFRHQRAIVDRVAAEVMGEARVRVKYLVGTMIEIPRACLVADEIARDAEFFSFGTNDLTQTTFGFSRDDAGKFLGQYLEQGILGEDPFITVDQRGVGELMRLGIQRGRKVRKDLEVGICGEHGGDPASVEFCHRVGLDYVSCSPYRVPVAKLAGAQAALRGTVRVKEMGEK
ncbi:MAG: putative PEP-binding protein, partial [Candidatus Methylomirabilales bacterium]